MLDRKVQTSQNVKQFCTLLHTFEKEKSAVFKISQYPIWYSRILVEN